MTMFGLSDVLKSARVRSICSPKCMTIGSSRCRREKVSI